MVSVHHIPNLFKRIADTPDQPEHWQQLHIALAAEPDLALRNAYLAPIRQLELRGSEGEYFRQLMLYALTRDLAHLAASVQHLKNCKPLRPEQWMAALSYHWHDAVSKTDNHHTFVQHLLAARTAELMAAFTAPLVVPVAPDLAAGTNFAAAPSRTILIILPEWGMPGHAPTLMALGHAAALRAQGFEVHMMCAQEHQNADIAKWIGVGTWNSINVPTSGLQAWAGKLPPGLQIYLADPATPIWSRVLALEARAKSLQPAAVLMIGFFSVLAARLRALAPQIGVSVHAVLPLQALDVALQPQTTLSSTSPWASSLPLPQVIPHSQRFPARGIASAIDRADLELTAQHIVLMSAGYRLRQECTSEWLHEIATVLRAHSQARWVLAGDESVREKLIEHGLAAQCVVLPHVHDLPTLMAACDIYINPPRLGGGMSVVQAMEQGLPVIALSGSHGGDGGDKLGADPIWGACKTVTRYVQRLHALMQSSSLRKAVGKSQQQHFHTHLNVAQAGPVLEQAIMLAREQRERSVRDLAK